jgi:hypothetical protein
MESTTYMLNGDKWGKENEQQLGADESSWRREMWLDKVPWKHDQFRELLEKYSKIPPSEIENEIFRIVSQSYATISTLTDLIHVFSETKPGT